MRMPNCISLILSLSLALVWGCGSDGEGGAVDPNAPTTIVLTTSKVLALANGSDAVTIRAEVRKADGTTAADGTAVTFSVPADSGTLSTSTASCTGGLASVTLTRAPVSGANNQTIAVTGAAGAATGTADVKFINQPTSVDVFIGLDRNVTNLAALSFTLNNSPGAAFDNVSQPISAVNAASGSLVVGNFDTAVNQMRVGMTNAGANGCSTGTAPIIKATFTVGANAGLPAFGVNPVPGTFTATDSANGATTPSMSAENIVVTVKYDTE